MNFPRIPQYQPTVTKPLSAPVAAVFGAVMAPEAPAKSTSSALVESMIRLLESNTGEITINSYDKKPIKAHLVILCNASEYFKLLKIDGVVEIDTELEYDDLMIIMRYIYARDENIDEWFYDVYQQRIFKTMDLARSWLLVDLVKIIEEKALTTIEYDNWYMFYRLSSGYCFDNIKNIALKRLKEFVIQGSQLESKFLKNDMENAPREHLVEITNYLLGWGQDKANDKVADKVSDAPAI